jgi:putative Mg2+ transporter-C (MgtC) family protein
MTVDTIAEVRSALAQEFGDIADAGTATRIVVRLLMAVLLAAVLGWERERRGRPAGLRTHMLVGLGAALFVLVPLEAGMADDAISRVLQGVISGIGFLGAGAIIKFDDAGRVQGLTTAASIWATAAIGVAVGLGHHLTAIVATLIALVILSILQRLER